MVAIYFPLIGNFKVKLWRLSDRSLDYPFYSALLNKVFCLIASKDLNFPRLEGNSVHTRLQF